jgi:hypothetical protein
MERFAFVKGLPERLKEGLHDWLSTWGVLRQERGKFVERILGTLLSMSMSSEARDAIAVMRRVLGADEALPLTPIHLGPSVVRDLERRMWLDPPTPGLISCLGTPGWMIDRSALLSGLPISFSEDPKIASTLERRRIPVRDGSARIFSIVGPGGTGKSALMAALLTQIAGVFWDWGSGRFRDEPSFLGYPLLPEAATHAVGSIDSALMTWGARREAYDQAVERFAIANQRGSEEPAVWLAADGLDEMPDEDMGQLAGTLANAVHDHPNLRIVLTSRPNQFWNVAKRLGVRGMMRPLLVGDLTYEEARDALLRATNHEIRLTAPSLDRLVAGAPRMDTVLPQSGLQRILDDSIRQPLFLGVVRRIYEREGVDVIQGAYDGDRDAVRHVVTECAYDLCERIARRVSNSYVTPEKVFRALQQLAQEVPAPTGATASDWERICEDCLDGHVVWRWLYSQCDGSGLIRGYEGGYGRGAFEWRHAFIGELLPQMSEDAGWQ